MPKNKIGRIFLFVVVGALFLCCWGAFVIEFFPRFIVLPTNFLDKLDNQSAWWNTTYSIRPMGFGRLYIWRSQSALSNEDKKTDWASIVAVFDAKLSELGWVRSEIFAPCRSFYMPEGNFLLEGENGIVHYFEKGYEDKIHFYTEYTGDTICLAVWPSSWNDDGSPEGFNIVILTVKLSPLYNFIDTIMQ